jgi:hypothetical protein
MQIEERVPGAGHSIPHLPPYSGVPACVRLAFDAWPSRFEVAHSKARVDIRLCRTGADSIVDTSVDAVVGYFVARAEGVGVVGERAVGNTARGASAIASEAVHWVEDCGTTELASIQLFLPVPEAAVSLVGNQMG